MRRLRWILSLGVLIGLAVGFYYFILDWDGRPFCHREFMKDILFCTEPNSCGDMSLTNAFPNINGKNADSIAEIKQKSGSLTLWDKNYRYVPGLRQDDPGDLVLMYIDRPTRWTWHGQVPTVFKEKAWIIVPVDFKFFANRPTAGLGELSERVSLDEFRRRLKGTIDFVRTNERPNWQMIVAEHTAFLESIEHLPH